MAAGQRYALQPANDVLLVSLGERKMAQQRLVAGAWQTLAEYVCAGSPRPPSNQEGSLATPLGLHQVAEKLGDGALAGTVFVGRVSTEQTYQQRDDFGPEQKALVTTRILWLSGLEPAVNQGGEVDSYRRYIYIHGTNHPEKLPNPHSAGCLNLHDDDLMALFATAPVGTWVWIEA